MDAQASNCEPNNLVIKHAKLYVIVNTIEFESLAQNKQSGVTLVL